MGLAWLVALRATSRQCCTMNGVLRVSLGAFVGDIGRVKDTGCDDIENEGALRFEGHQVVNGTLRLRSQAVIDLRGG